MDNNDSALSKTLPLNMAFRGAADDAVAVVATVVVAAEVEGTD